MTITKHFEIEPDFPALIIVETGETLTYRELEMASRRLAWRFAQWGLQPEDRIAIFMDNRAEFFIAAWAGLRMGLRVAPINRFLKAEEAAYIVENSDAKVVIACETLASAARELPALLPNVQHFIAAGGPIDGYTDFSALCEAAPDGPPPARPSGTTMFYTSGTTGQPKGAMYELDGRAYSDGLSPMFHWLGPLMGLSAGHRFFIAAPIYHSGPCFAALGVQALGGTVVMMKKFDASAALRAMQTHRVTHAYLVPTMMLRMLKLPEAERQAFDPSTLECVLHTAEPCPPEVKRQMIGWWGPKLVEIYGASESPEGTEITSQEWLRKPGSVGRAVGCTIHIVDDEGQDLPTGAVGTIYFESPASAMMSYHKDPAKTASMHNDKGWLTVGDVGYLDEDGYLFLTDRQHHMVISGGVNIYPRESEIALLIHPDVLDAVSFGVPDAEMGERLISVVTPKPGVAPGPDLAQRLIDHCRARIAHYKCPKQIFFEEELPRLPTGKIYKHVIKEKYVALCAKGLDEKVK